MSRRIFIAIAALAAYAATAVALAAPASDPVQVSVNAHGGRGAKPKQATAAVTRSGRQLVVWLQDDDPDGSVIWGRVISAGGSPVGGPFQIAGPNPNALAPAVAVRGRRDEFLVAWNESDFETRRVVARRFDGDGNPVGDRFTFSEAGQDPAIAYGGKRKEFVVVWREFTADGSRIYGTTLPAGDSTASESAPVSRDGSGVIDEYAPAVAYDSRTGRWLVAWTRAGRSQSTALARILPQNPNEPRGRQRRLAKPGSGSTSLPQVTYNRRAREYLATWSAVGSAVRRVHSDGRPYGPEVRLREGTPFKGVLVADIAAAADGHYEILFSGDEDPDVPPGDAVFARRLGAELKLGRRLQRVSSSDRRTSASGHAIVYSRANERFRAVWVEGTNADNDPNYPPPDWEVWTRVL